ncbi:MAG TPA: hypothetical protein VJ252_08370 [Chthoniobacterales bacterium]|nr:hypothetical protein [Chthoniobacterales bacterium]
MAAPNNIQFNGVGGLRTYANDQLAQLPLKWIMEKAALHGLAFRVSVEIDGDVTTSPVCDSYGPFLYGSLGKRFFREVGQKLIVEPNSTRETINETIDASVFQRWANDETYRPENLDDWRQGILLIQQKSVLRFSPRPKGRGCITDSGRLSSACLALRFLFPSNLLTRFLRRFRTYIRSQRKGALLQRDGCFRLRLCEHLNVLVI